MSVIHTNNITNKDGTSGPTISGITNVSSTGFMQVPVGDTRTRIVLPNENIVTDGLVLYLDAGKAESFGGDGTTWRDLSGENNNGTLTNGVGFTEDYGGSLIFDGVNDYVNCGNSSALNPSSSFTLSCWFKISNLEEVDGESKGLVGKYTGAGGNFRQFMLYYNSSTLSPSFIVSKDGTTVQNTTIKSITSESVLKEVWCNVTGVFTVSQKMEIFLNGELKSSEETPYLTQVYTGSPENFTIGTNTIGYGPSFSRSSISGVSLYNRALSTSEVQQNFNALRSRYGI
jgi:hypothetical protein